MDSSEENVNRAGEPRPEAGETPSEIPLAPPVRIGSEDIASYDAAQAPAEGIAITVPPGDGAVSWSWAHLIVFAMFSFGSLVVVQTAFALYYAPQKHLASEKELERYFLSKPQFAIGSMLIWYATLFLFLYVTLAVLRNGRFWKSLGWTRFKPEAKAVARNPLVYFFSGCALSILVILATAATKAPENTPIQELMKYRSTALLFMGMAVFIAPLVEETLFRGYLYPLFARSFGMTPAIIVTGTLFGLMHGAQLGWTWGLVIALSGVGMVLTLARARTGTVLASFFLHLGYNSMLAVTSILATRGFTQT